MKNKILKNILFFFLIVFICFIYGFSKKRNEIRKVKKIKIEFTGANNEFLTHNLVGKMLKQNGKFVRNISKKNIYLNKLENNVLKNSYVEKVNIFLTLEGELKVEVKQKKPIVRIVNKDNNKGFYLDKKGKMLPLSNNFSPRVPLAYGLKTFEELKELKKLINFISKDDFLKKEIIGVEKKNNDNYFLYVRSGSYNINIGDVNNLQNKFIKLKAFYKKTLNNELINKYKIITLKYRNQVVCTKKNQYEEQ